ncbi:MAG: SMI1/KNR4 family protein [Candidatus Caldarchaeum sp.]
MVRRVSYQEISRRIRGMEETKFGRGASEEQISEAEQLLGITFPPSYKKFLSEFGWADIDGEEIYGLGDDVPSSLHLVRKTLAEREAAGLPLYWIPIHQTWLGNLTCLDGSRSRRREYPVVLWRLCPEEEVIELSDNFVEWMFEYIISGIESDLPEGIKLEELEPITWAEHRQLHRQQRELKRLREAWEQATIPWPKPPRSR